MDWVAIILSVIGVAVAGYVGWISVQSLMQASLLRQASGVGMSGLDSGKPVALYGQTRVLRPLRWGARECLWWHVKHQKYSGWGRNRRWRTVDDVVETAQFVLDCGGREVLISDHPTEVQSAHRETQYGVGGFLFSRERTIAKWLPVLPRVTVLGRLEGQGDNLTMVKSPKVGLLFSPHEPGRAAAQEMMKGIAGLVLVVGLIAAGWYFFQLPG